MGEEARRGGEEHVDGSTNDKTWEKKVKLRDSEQGRVERNNCRWKSSYQLWSCYLHVETTLT